MFYYHGEQLYAVRQGPYKAHFLTKTSYVKQKAPVTHDPPLLYHLEHDPSEKHDIAAEQAEIVGRLKTLAEEHRASVERVPSQLESRLPAAE